MLQIGPTLRQARESRGLQPADVEAGTRIRAKYLVALEEERFETLPLGYARPFLRAYAEYLGLKGQPFVDALAARLPPEAEPLLSHPQQPRLRFEWIPSRRPLAVLACIAVLLALLVAGLGSKRGEVAVPVAKPTRTARAHVQRAVPPPARYVRHVEAKRTRLLLTAARGDCWILVRAGSRAGQTLYENLLRRGQTLSFARPGLWIRLGAPGNLDIRLNGRRIGRFPGNTPRNVIVTARDVSTIS